MAINEEDFKRKTEREIKNYDLMKTIFSKIYEIEKELKKKRLEVFDNISSIEDEDNKILTNIYKDFTEEMKGLENIREKLMIKINEKIVPATKYYSSQAKKEKKDIGNYKDKKKENTKQQYELEKAKSVNNTIKQSQLKEDIEKSRLEINDAQGNLQRSVLEFEKDRIINNKYIILHFIHCEMAYHAKSVEKLSKLFKSIKEIEPIDDLPNFQKSYNLSNVNLEEHGYDEKAASRRSRLGKSSINNSVKNSNFKSLKVSGLGNSKNEMLKKSGKNDLDQISEVEDSF